MPPTAPAQTPVNPASKVSPTGNAAASQPAPDYKALPKLVKAELYTGVVEGKDIIGVKARAEDSYGDEAQIEYEWKKNDEPAGDSPVLGDLKRGDRIEVKVTPVDGLDYGPPRILRTRVANTSPKITGYSTLSSEGDYKYQVEAVDSDGDTLTYAVKSGPPGITVDPSTGIVSWTQPPDFKGRADVLIEVTDGHGGSGSYGFSIGIK